jgi:hypothetical protein
MFSQASLCLQAAKSQFCEYIVSALCVSVLPEKELLRFHFKEVTLGNLAFKYFIMLPNFYLVL